jgi:hypothetical protein
LNSGRRNQGRAFGGEARWQQEREFAKQIVELRAAIAADDSDRRRHV